MESSEPYQPRFTEEILEVRSGKKPTEVFHKLVAANPDLDNFDLAIEFVLALPEVDSIVVNYIWKFSAPGVKHGLPDERLDEVLIQQLMLAGYLQSP